MTSHAASKRTAGRGRIQGLAQRTGLWLQHGLRLRISRFVVLLAFFPGWPKLPRAPIWGAHALLNVQLPASRFPFRLSSGDEDPRRVTGTLPRCRLRYAF